MLTVVQMIGSLVTSLGGDALGAVFGIDTAHALFSVNAAQCTSQSCPGSFYTAIATAWANIGYLTHADVLRFLKGPGIGGWAALLYIGSAVAGFIGVMTNSPMKNWVWFFFGPCLYYFLVETTVSVQGVNWVVANKAVADMSEVWKNAEAGLANTRLARDNKITINGKDGPSGQYDVALPMVFLDELFSATTNIIVEWTGIGTEVAGTGSQTNLSALGTNGKAEGDWWLLSNLKWGYIENIVGATLRNPDVRDAFVTFLSSECGDQFKQAINSGAYIAATQSRGSSAIQTVMKGVPSSGGTSGADYKTVTQLLSKAAIPTPRSLGRLYTEGKDELGSFKRFDQYLYDDKPSLNGRTQVVVCSEYLWTIIQAFRFEAGQAYYQLVRSSPSALKQDQFVRALLYGWDVRKDANATIANEQEQSAFIKHLILAYILRNELLYAPQITTVDQRFAPSEQSRSYGEAYIQTVGSKQKYTELYNMAVMMPYLQGILAYLLVAGYPFACMLVLLPGHYKGFFTWVQFFAWVKLWDVGFAIVQVLERSVWAMIGNHSSMAATAQVLIKTATDVGGIGVTNPSKGFVGPQPTLGAQKAFEAVPLVCSLKAGTVDGDCVFAGAGDHQLWDDAIKLFDKLLVASANLDLDLSNGWYIYIMSALYFAVPAVTGQLVLGAKAGMAGMLKDAYGGASQDAAGAAKTGYQQTAVASAMTNAQSLDQAALAKGYRKNGKDSLAMQSFGASNDSMNMGLTAAEGDNVAKAMDGRARAHGTNLSSYERAAGAAQAMVTAGQDITKFGTSAFDWKKASAPTSGAPSGGGPSAGGTALNNGATALASGAVGVPLAMGKVEMGRRADEASISSIGIGQDMSWRSMEANQRGSGMRDYSGKLQSAADFDAKSSAWEARNAFSSHVSAMAGIAGMNAGNLAPGAKPNDMQGLAMSGNLNGYQGYNDGEQKSMFGGEYWTQQRADGNMKGDVQSQAGYSGTGFQSRASATAAQGQKQFGGNFVTQPWTANGGSVGVAQAEEIGVANSFSDNVGAGGTVAQPLRPEVVQRGQPAENLARSPVK